MKFLIDILDENRPVYEYNPAVDEMVCVKGDPANYWAIVISLVLGAPLVVALILTLNWVFST